MSLAHKESHVVSGEPAIGLNARARAEVAKCLSHLLAETYLLQLKTKYYHWNVTGPHFQGLHTLFDTQYTALATAVDEIAERIRAIGHTTPGTFQEFLKLAGSVEEDKTLPEDWQTMVKNLTSANESLIRAARKWLVTVQDLDDEGTSDLFIRRLQEHEKAAWMLRSHIQ